LIIDDVLAVYKVSSGSFFCVVGDIDENPYILVCMIIWID